MSADLLRRAATLMRERARAATPGTWQHFGDTIVWPSDNGPAANDPIMAFNEAHEECAAHVASWHPLVALAVADWLDFIAPFARFGDDDSLHAKHALAVARAYLGKAS